MPPLGRSPQFSCEANCSSAGRALSGDQILAMSQAAATNSGQQPRQLVSSSATSPGNGGNSKPSGAGTVLVNVSGTRYSVG